MAEFPIILDRLEETMPASPGYILKCTEALSLNLSQVGGGDEPDDLYLNGSKRRADARKI